MEQNVFCSFYKNTVLSYPKNIQNRFCKRLVDRNIITNDETSEKIENVFYVPQKQDTDVTIGQLAENITYAYVFEELEFTKLYKYSIPLMFEHKSDRDNIDSIIENLSNTASIVEFKTEKSFVPEYDIADELYNATPLYMKEGSNYCIKFVIQQDFLTDQFETIDYRYPIIIYINTEEKLLDIRFDGLKYKLEGQSTIEWFNKIYKDCISWIEENLKVDIFKCDNCNMYESIKSEKTGKVKICRQMMTLATGGSADLKAADNEDNPTLPFVDEIRELINENATLFEKSPEIKALLTKYIDDKEDTADYPYIYIKCINEIASQNFLVKITSSYVCGNMTLQYLSGSNNKMGMERMNYVIGFLKKIDAITKGESIS